MSDRSVQLWLVGVGCAVAALAVCLVVPKALGGWLMAFVFWSSLPLGALVLLMMIRIIPGKWRRELGGAAEVAILLSPLALLAVLPVFAGLGALYPWADTSGEGGFRGAYLMPWSFVLRTVLFFALSVALAVLLMGRPRWSMPVSVAGLILFVPFDTAIAFDWLMSLDPKFHSSGFGLYILSIQVVIAVCLLILAYLSAGPRAGLSGIPGAVLLSALLLWAYFAFMQFFIIWSTNLPHGVLWYQHRSGGAWTGIMWVVAALHFLPAFLLLFSPFRRGRAWLMGFAAAILVGKALEVSWLVLPNIYAGFPSVAVALLSLGGLGALTAAAVPRARRWRNHAMVSAAEREFTP
ncbi:hypothetical protein [Chelativorans sp. AA-79]|uniref:hypothetical protein n=1 Tax=Chelativorans sp. AA-79 TaxID=3028735 RepID=UPI0023F6D567|nr:hypothetical protein [Chelativorans sp. AA-79]WEX10567.1 hypothetical protein PVE73_06310 [Chelativorans sp. AA-79]